MKKDRGGFTSDGATLLLSTKSPFSKHQASKNFRTSHVVTCPSHLTYKCKQHCWAQILYVASPLHNWYSRFQRKHLSFHSLPIHLKYLLHYFKILLQLNILLRRQFLYKGKKMIKIHCQHSKPHYYHHLAFTQFLQKLGNTLEHQRKIFQQYICLSFNSLK